MRTYPISFYKQKVLGKYIVDFYCAKAKLVVELDGSGHYRPEAAMKDIERTTFLENYGLTVIRFTNIDVDTNFEGVCLYIDRAVKTALSSTGFVEK